jgi:hypothetical protein
MYAMEFVLSLCETAPDMLRKHMGPIETVMQIAAGWACHMKDDPLWHTKDDHFNIQSFADDSTDTASALTAIGDDTLDRIPKAIGGRACVRGLKNSSGLLLLSFIGVWGCGGWRWGEGRRFVALCQGRCVLLKSCGGLAAYGQ